MSLSRAEYISLLNNLIPDNSTQQISPADVRSVLTDLVESIPYFITDKELSTLNLGSEEVRNTRVGDLALSKLSIVGTYNEDNAAFGYYALGANYSGIRNTALGSYSLGCSLYGNENAAVGFSSAGGNLTGSGNVALGNYSLRNNKYGDFNIAIGHGAGCNVDQNTNYKLFIGSYPVDSGSPCLSLPPESGFTHLMYGELDNLKLGIAVKSLHNMGTLQVSGSVSPAFDKVGNLGHPYYTWGAAYLASGLGYNSDSDFIISRVTKPFPSQYELNRIGTFTSDGKVGFGTLPPSGAYGFMTVDGSLVPAKDKQYSLGHPDLKWNGYFGNIVVSGTATINDLEYVTKTECLYECKTLHLATSGLCPDDIYSSTVCGYLSDEGIDGAGFEVHSSGNNYRRDYRLIYRFPDQTLSCLEEDDVYSRARWESNISLAVVDGRHVQTQRVLSKGNLSLVSESGCFGAFIRPNRFIVGNEPLLSSGNSEVNFVFASGFSVVNVAHGSGLTIKERFLSRNRSRGFDLSYIDAQDVLVSGRQSDRFVISSVDSTNKDIVTILRSGALGVNDTNGTFIPQTIFNVQATSGCVGRLSSISGNTKLQLLAASNTLASGLEVVFNNVSSQDPSGVRPVVDFNVVSPSGTNGAISILENNFIGIGHTIKNGSRVFDAHAPLTVRHDGSLSGTVSLKSQSVKPSQTSGYGKLYVKPVSVSPQTESIFFLDGSNNEYNLILNQNSTTDGLVYTDNRGNTAAGITPSSRPLNVNSVNNTAYGYMALNSITNASGNSVFGSSAKFLNNGNNNTIVGHNSFAASGSNNVIVGAHNLSDSPVENINGSIILGYEIPYTVVENNTLAIGCGTSPLVVGSISGTRNFFIKNGTLGVKSLYDEQEAYLTHTIESTRNVSVFGIKDTTTAGSNDGFLSLRFIDQNNYTRTLVDFDYSANPLAITPTFNVPSPLRPFIGVSGDIKLLGAVRFADGTFLDTATLNAALNFYDLPDALSISTEFTTANSYMALSVPSGGDHIVGRITLQSLADYVGSGFAAVSNNCNHIWSNVENQINKTNNSNSVFIGCNVAVGATGWKNSIIIGSEAGYGATTPNTALATDTSCIFIGNQAGREADNTANTIAIGTNAAYNAYNSARSIYIGSNAGNDMHGNENIGIGFHALRGSGTSSTGSRNIEIVTGLLDNQRLMAGSGNLSDRINIQNTIAGDTNKKKISIGHATLNPDAPLTVRRNSTAIPGHAENDYIQTWWCNGVKVAHIDCQGNFSSSTGGAVSGVIEGVAAESISAPASPASPTSGIVTIKDANWNTIGSIHVLNRDPTLTVSNGAYVQAVMINGTYRFQWVSCGV